VTFDKDFRRFQRLLLRAHAARSRPERDSSTSR
jgi:hypothetical protein